MRRLLLIAALALCACQPNRSGIEGVFLEREKSRSNIAYEKLRDEAYRSLRREGPAEALPAFMRAYRTAGAGAQSWELLPVIARLELARHQPAMARRMAVTARLSHRLSLGELSCAPLDAGTFLIADGRPPFGAEDMGSAALVSMTMCRPEPATRPRRERDGGDALFERKLTAVEALLPPGASGPAANTP
jgi:hypothetical protein